MSLLLEMFTYPFILRAFVVGILVALCAALLGVPLVLKRYSMIGDGLSHVSFGALSIALACGWAPLPVSIPVVVLAALGLLRMTERSRMGADAAIAVVSASALAVGVVVTSLTTGMTTDVDSFMFGSILAMDRADVALSVGLCAAVLVLYVLFYHRLFAITFDESFARATGVKVGLYNTILSVLTALTIVLGMRMMGAMLISSLVIFPALSAMRVLKSFRGVVICSGCISVASFCVGLTSSYLLGTPVGASVVLVDLAEVAKIAHRHGAKVFVDNTFATPYNTNPLDLGVDVVIHSLTKYIGGHGDLLGGAVISNDTEFLRQCRLGTLMHFGAVMAPFTAFLVCRGMKTLGVRMRQHNENALKIARWLEADPRIETVRYPFLESNSQYDIAKKQMRGGGGMISFDVKGGLEAGKKFINSLKLCTLAVSLGDTETLVEQAAAMTHTMIPKEVREAAGITDGMIRMSVGLEDPDDIIADLNQALSR